jgi:hypothetical protein
MNRTLAAVAATTLSLIFSVTPIFAQTTLPPTAPQQVLNPVKLPKSAQISRQTRSLIQPAAPTQFLAPTRATAPSVSFDDPIDYRHDSGLFSMRLPSAWKLTDLSNERDLHIAFVDPSASALFLIRLTKADDALGNDGLSKLLSAYLNGQFEGESNYQPGDPQEVSEGVMGAQFQFNGKNSNRSMIGEGYALQNGALASTIVFLADASQYDNVVDSAREVLSSFRLSPGATEPGQTPVNADIFALGELTSYAHPSGAFEIDAPASWARQTNDDPGSLLSGWVEPGGRGEIVVEMVKTEKKFTKAQMVQVVGNYVKQIYGDKDGYRADKAKSATNDIAYIFFNMRRDVGDETMLMVGIVYAFQSGNNVLFLREVVPQSELENTAQALDAVANSVKINPNTQYLR